MIFTGKKVRMPSVGARGSYKGDWAALVLEVIGLSWTGVVVVALP